MIRPLLPVLFALICGILLEYQWHLATACWASPAARPYFVGSCALLLGAWGLFHCRRSHRGATIILLLLAGLVGMTRYAVSQYLPARHIAHFIENERVTIEGMLYKAPEVAPKKYYLYISVHWLEQGNIRYQVCGNIRITVSGSPLESMRYGDMIRTRLRLRVPKNFADFDYRAYLRRRNIYLVGFLKHHRYLITLPEQHGHLVLHVADRLRQRLLRFLATYQQQHPSMEPEIQIIKAVTLGTSRTLSAPIRAAFRMAGMYHFLVVSGVHVGIFVWGLHTLFQFSFVPLRYRSVVLALFLLLYMGLTGFQFPVVRASIMAFVLYFSITCNRVPEALYSLAFSVFFILLMVPTALFEASFQLTVAATASILLLYRRVQQADRWNTIASLHVILRLPLLTLLMAIGAMLGIAPLLLFYFQELSAVTLLSNVLAFPIVSVFLPFSLALMVSSLLLPWTLLFPLVTVDVWLARCFWGLTQVLPTWMIVLPAPTLLSLGLYYTVLYLIMAQPLRSRRLKLTEGGTSPHPML